MTPLPWSHSSLTDFLNCPKAYYHKRIAKDVTEETGEAALWGDYVHKHFEAYLKANGELVLVPGLEQYKGYLDDILGKVEDGELLVEQQLALNRRVQPCGWVDPEVWCRGIVDVLIIRDNVAYVIDHKTGKPKTDSKQLKLFALLIFAHHPEIDTCFTEYAWLKDGTKTTECYTRSREADLWQDFLGELTRYRTAFKAEVFNPRQSGLCNGWCPVTGCEFWKPKKERR